MKKLMTLSIALLMLCGLFSGCSVSTESTARGVETPAQASQTENEESLDQSVQASAEDRKTISMWFWGANENQKAAFQAALIDVYNSSQNEYELVIEYRNTVDNDIPVALSASSGPDIIYTSGPSFCNVYVTEDKLVDLTPYAEQYGWKDRLLQVYYDACTVDGKLYSVPNSISVGGIFYNKALFQENNWQVPSTLAEMIDIMEEAKSMGLYGGSGGNRGWRPSNDNFSSVMINHFVSPTNLYECLSGNQPFSNPEMLAGVQMMQDWYKAGYLAGNDYTALDSQEAVQLIADKRAAFLMAPTLYIQFAANSFTDNKIDEFGFAPMPNLYAPDKDVYDLTMPCSFAVNTSSKAPDECAKILDIMLSAEFCTTMTEYWPGYWAVPLKDMSGVDDSNMAGMSIKFMEIIKEAVPQINAGNFGYHPSAFFPPVTQDEWRNVDSVWQGVMTPEEFLNAVDKAFAEELEAGLVAPLAKPAV